MSDHADRMEHDHVYRLAYFINGGVTGGGPQMQRDLQTLVAEREEARKRVTFLEGEYLVRRRQMLDERNRAELAEDRCRRMAEHGAEWEKRGRAAEAEVARLRKRHADG